MFDDLKQLYGFVLFKKAHELGLMPDDEWKATVAGLIMVECRAAGAELPHGVQDYIDGLKKEKAE